MRSLVGSVFLLSLCVGLAVSLNVLYAGVAFLTALLALTSGVYLMLAIALGAVWPVLMLAFVQYILKNANPEQPPPGGVFRGEGNPE